MYLYSPFLSNWPISMEVCINFLQLLYIVIYCVSTAIITLLQLYSLFCVLERKRIQIPTWVTCHWVHLIQIMVHSSIMLFCQWIYAIQITVHLREIFFSRRPSYCMFCLVYYITCSSFCRWVTLSTKVCSITCSTFVCFFIRIAIWKHFVWKSVAEITGHWKYLQYLCL